MDMESFLIEQFMNQSAV